MQQIHLAVYENANTIVTDAYDRFIAKIPMMRKSNGYSLYTISACEPGAGATTISINISVALANAGWKTLLVDGDIRKSPTEKRLSAEASHGLSDYLNGEKSFDEAVCETNIDNLSYLSCGSPVSNPVKLFNSAQFDQFVNMAGGMYDYVIFDSPSLNAAVDASIIASKTSGVILVAGYKRTHMGRIRSARQEIEHAGANLIGIVMNSVPKQDYKKYIKNYDYFASKRYARKPQKAAKR